MVHAGMSEHVQQRTCRPGFFIPRTKHHRADPAVDHGTGAHDAGFEGNVERGVQQAVVLQYQSALAQGHDFGMGSRVVTPNRAVPAFANHLVIVDQHGAHRDFTLFPGAFGKLERMAHPVFMIEFKGGQRSILQSESGRIIHTRYA